MRKKTTISVVKQSDKYKPTKKDLLEINSLLIFLSGVTERTPIKCVEFIKNDNADTLLIERWDNVDKKTFSTVVKRLKKLKNKKNENNKLHRLRKRCKRRVITRHTRP